MTAQATIVVDVPADLWFTSNNLRGSHHRWTPKIRALRAIGKAAAIKAGSPRFEVAALWVKVGYPTNTKADPPNIAGTVAKALIDGFVDAGVLPDDDSRHIVATTYERGPKCAKGVHRMEFLFIDQEVRF